MRAASQAPLRATATGRVLCIAKTGYAKRLTPRTVPGALTVTLSGPSHKSRGRVLLHG